eukprot:7387907-Karenia_brevis.AAC.1
MNARDHRYTPGSCSHQSSSPAGHTTRGTHGAPPLPVSHPHQATPDSERSTHQSAKVANIHPLILNEVNTSQAANSVATCRTSSVARQPNIRPSQ